MRYEVAGDRLRRHDRVRRQVDEPTVAALRRAKSRGPAARDGDRPRADRPLQHVRALGDSSSGSWPRTAPCSTIPATKAVEPISPPPPPALVETLERQSVPLSVGHSIVATVEPYEHQVLAAIRDLGLEWHVIFNKGSVMALPADVTKATGLAPALGALGVVCRPDGRRRRRGKRSSVPADVRARGGGGQCVAGRQSDGGCRHAGARGAGVSELIARLLAGEFETLVRRH